MAVKIARCCGMCNGVKRALDIVEDALKQCEDETLYVYNEIVHNSFVINELKKKNIVFVHNVDEIPDGASVVFSAHGVSADIENRCKKKALRIFDATCLLVKKNHHLAECADQEGKGIIFIGKKSHPECIGTVGRVRKREDLYCHVVEKESDIELLPEFDSMLVSIAQTTLSVADVEKICASLSKKFMHIQHFGGICFATSERQAAVRELASECDLILVAGSKTSSNSCRLQQIAIECGCDALLIDDIAVMDDIDLDKYCNIGITAGASTPDIKIKELIERVSGR